MDYPLYSLQSSAPGELGVFVEMRIQLGSAGGLPGMQTETAVVQALQEAVTAAGATWVSASALKVASTPIPAIAEGA